MFRTHSPIYSPSAWFSLLIAYKKWGNLLDIYYIIFTTNSNSCLRMIVNQHSGDPNLLKSKEEL